MDGMSGRGLWCLSLPSVTSPQVLRASTAWLIRSLPLIYREKQTRIFTFSIFPFRMSFDAGSWPGCELCWPQAATPSTAWTPRPPPLLPPSPPLAPSPHQPPPLWPMDIAPTQLLGALLRSSSINLLTTSQQR